MSYTPNNTSVYLQAFAGCIAGLTLSGRYPLSAFGADYQGEATQADAFAQEIDTVFGASTPTGFELLALQTTCAWVWSYGRSPLTANATTPTSYTQLAKAIVALVQESNAQVVAEGINPNGGGGGGGGGSSTATTVVAGQTYAMQTSDAAIRFNSTNGQAAGAPIAQLPVPSYIGERHTFIWFQWDANQVPPEVQTDSNARVMTPFTGMTASDTFVTSSIIPQAGNIVTLMWDGSEWISC